MRKTVKIIIISFLVIMATGSEAFSQLRFSAHDKEKGLEIDKRWRRSKLFNKQSDAILVLKITNTLDHAVEAKISIGFYKKGILEYISEEQTICFEPGQTKRGGKDNLRFVAEEISIADTREEDFLWDFAKLEVIRVDKCD